MEVKKHFKLYKSGKLWCCAAIATAALTFGATTAQADSTATADNMPAQVATTTATGNNQSSTTASAGQDSSNTAANNTTTNSNATTDQTTTTNSTSATASQAATTTTNQTTTQTTTTSTQDASSSTTTNNTSQAAVTPVVLAAVVAQPASASVNTSATSANIIDVSAYQGNISEATYQQYKNQGVNNVVVKLTESTSWTNGYAAAQVNNAKAAGLTVSAYHFVRFTTAAEAQAEATHFAQVARQLGLSSDTLMIADVESVAQTRYAGIVNNLNVFWNTLSALGYTNHGVYTGLSYDRTYNVSSTVGKARTWVAMYYYDYSANAARDSYIAGLGYGAWQYTDRWNGIDGSVDLGMFANYAGGQQVTSAANLDSYGISSDGNTLNISGWFADSNNEGKNNRYVIVLDQDNGNKEVARQQVAATSRTDVANVYPNLYGASTSGFSASIPLNSALINAIQAGHHLQIIFRYTSSSDGNSAYNDHWFSNVALNQNLAAIDSKSITDSGITVTGWHAADQAVGRGNHTIILLDSTTGKEIARQQVTNTERDDVQRAYPNLYNSKNSGFTAFFAMTDALKSAIEKGDSLQIVSRYYSNDSNSNCIDYWFTPIVTNQNQAALDDFSIYNGHLRVVGWHAADKSVVEPNQLILLFDTQTGKEVARVNAATEKRSDIAKYLPNILNSGNSGFVADFDISQYKGLQQALLEGHSLQAMARYCDSTTGEGNITDYWFDQKKQFTNDQSAAYLENFGISGNSLNVKGWYADSRSLGAQAMYVILRDVTTGKELGRQRVTQGQNRPDIAKYYSNINGAGKSGFNVSFDIDSTAGLAQALKNGDSLQVVARYTNDTQTGEGTYVHHFFAAKSFKQNIAALDTFAVQSNGSIQATGWHVSDQFVGRSYHYVILFDATQGREITRIRVNDNVARPDIARLYPDVYNSGNSGFNVNFVSSSAIKQAIARGHKLQIIDRYSSAENGNSDYVDYWFDARNL